MPSRHSLRRRPSPAYVNIPNSNKPPLNNELIDNSPAQWHQWLRYVRSDPPSLLEQQKDVIRQIQLKHLARIADERWASKPSYLDRPPQTQQPTPATRTTDPTLEGAERNTQSTEAEGTESTAHQAQAQTQTQTAQTRKDEGKKKEEEDPWAKVRAGNPGDGWQPESWTPTAAKR